MPLLILVSGFLLSHSFSFIPFCLPGYIPKYFPSFINPPMPNLVVSSHSHCLFTHLSFCPEMKTPSSPKRRGGSSFSPTLLVPPLHHHLAHCPQMTPILPLRPIVTDRRPVSSALALLMSGAQTNRTGSFRLLSSSKHEIGSSNKEGQIRTRLITISGVLAKHVFLQLRAPD